MSYLKLKKNNYLAIIPFTGNKKMVEIEANNEDDAYKKAIEYAKGYCEVHGCMFVNPMITQIPDCITII